MATITSVQNGNWSDPATWGGTAPAAGDTVNIRHIVTMDLEDFNATTIFGRINIEGAAVNASYNGQLIYANGSKCLCCSMWLYVNGGRFEMKPGSVLKFKSTSKSGSAEGQVVGIYGKGDTSGTQIVLQGSVPLPETTLTQDVYLRDHILKVADASGFSPGEYIAVYYDSSQDAQWSWIGREQSDEGFIIHDVVGNDIYIRQRVGREAALTQNISIGQNYAIVDNINIWKKDIKVIIDREAFVIDSIDVANNKIIFKTQATVAHTSGTKLYETGCEKRYMYDIVTTNMPIGQNYCYVINPLQFQTGMQIKILDEVFTISSIDVNNKKLTFTANATKAHCVNEMIALVSDLSHASGNKVYKIATVLTANSNAGTNTITVANSTMLNVGDRILIEGYTRTYGKEFEVVISSKNGNTLTLNANLPYNVSSGFIVTKTNRDCVVTSTDQSDDQNRICMYYIYGDSSKTNRKCVLRNVEFSHITNSSSETYSGVTIRSDFNRFDNEREMRNCVIRDGWNAVRSGVWAYSSHYMHYRNNVTYKTLYGINTYDMYGSSFYNNIGIGNITSGTRFEHQYYYNQEQYNINLNTDYGILVYSMTSAKWPMMHNISKHTNRCLHLTISNSSFSMFKIYKNKFEDVYYRQLLTETYQQFIFDNVITYASDVTWGTWNSVYGDPDERAYGISYSLNQNFINDYFEMHTIGGIIQKETSIHNGNGFSLKFNCIDSLRSNRLSTFVYLPQNTKVKVSAYILKTSSYNGIIMPRLIVKGYDTGYIYKEMQNINDTWQRVDLEVTTKSNELVEIAVSGMGTGPSVFYLDPRIYIESDNKFTITDFSQRYKFANINNSNANFGIILNGLTL